MYLSNKFKILARNFSLLLVGILLFVLCQPNVIVSDGLGFLAFVALVPMFVLASTTKVSASIVWGLLYGALANGGVVLWLFSFSKIAFVAVIVGYGIFFALLFPLLNILARNCGRFAWLGLWLVYLGYEYAKTLGFIGFSYGVIGYSQWNFAPLVRTASLFGVWGVSAIVVFPSAVLACALREFWLGKTAAENSAVGAENASAKTAAPKTSAKTTTQKASGKNEFFEFLYCFRPKALLLGIWLLVFVVFMVLPPILDSSQNQSQTKKKIALVQPNSDPWEEAPNQHKKDLEILLAISERAISAERDLDLVVWPETAFVPRIKWHYRFRQDHRTFELVDRLLTFIDKQPVPFLIGNDEALYSQAVAGESSDLEDGRVDYNAALLFEPGKNVIPPRPTVYYKKKLVPLTENFPYKDIFPGIYEFLQNANTHFYAPGEEDVVFDCAGIRFSVPICFEDTFGTVTRAFAKAGAQLLVGMSNDAWSKTRAAQVLHLSTSVFRAAEVGLPMVRSTADGITCAIDRTGKITQTLESFGRDFLVAETYIPEKSSTLYFYVGDFLGNVFLVCGIMVIIFSIFKNVKLKKTHNERKIKKDG